MANLFSLPRNFLLACLLLGLTACAADDWSFGHDVSANEKALAAQTDPVALRIAESADRAAAALQDLARVEQTRRPPAPMPAAPPAASDLNQPVTVDWVGPAEGLARNLAQRLDYHFLVTGPAPKVPVVVRVQQTQRPMVEALRNIGEQGTEFLDIVVDPAARKLELRYRAAEATRS